MVTVLTAVADIAKHLRTTCTHSHIGISDA